MRSQDKVKEQVKEQVGRVHGDYLSLSDLLVGSRGEDSLPRFLQSAEAGGGLECREPVLESHLFQSCFCPGFTVTVPCLDYLSFSINEVSHWHGGHAGERFVLHHGPRGGAGSIEGVWESDVVGFQIVQSELLSIGGIDTQDDQSFVFVFFVELLETPCLLAASGSATAPFVKPDDLSAKIGELDPSATDRGQVEIGSQRAWLEQPFFYFGHAPLLPPGRG